MAQVIAAAQQANAHDFVMQFPSGWACLSQPSQWMAAMLYATDATAAFGFRIGVGARHTHCAAVWALGHGHVLGGTFPAGCDPTNR